MNTIYITECPNCKGEFTYYDGALGYESLKCKGCGLDIKDIEVNYKKEG